MNTPDKAQHYWSERGGLQWITGTVTLRLPTSTNPWDQMSTRELINPNTTFAITVLAYYDVSNRLLTQGKRIHQGKPNPNRLTQVWNELVYK